MIISVGSPIALLNLNKSPIPYVANLNVYHIDSKNISKQEVSENRINWINLELQKVSNKKHLKYDFLIIALIFLNTIIFETFEKKKMYLLLLESHGWVKQ